MYGPGPVVGAPPLLHWQQLEPAQQRVLPAQRLQPSEHPPEPSPPVVGPGLVLRELQY